MSGSDSDSSFSGSLIRVPSYADFLEGFKSARMSFEPLEDWLFVHTNEDHDKSEASDGNESESLRSEHSDHTNAQADCPAGDAGKNSDGCVENETSWNDEDDDDYIIHHCDSSSDEYSDDEINAIPGETLDGATVNVRSADSAEQNSTVSHLSQYSPFQSDRYVTCRKHHNTNGASLPLACGHEKSVETNFQLMKTENVQNNAEVSSNYVARAIEYKSYNVAGVDVACEPLHSNVRMPLSSNYFNCQSQNDTGDMPAVVVKKWRSDIPAESNEVGCQHYSRKLVVSEADNKDQEVEDDNAAKRAHKRKRIIQEILDTEATYHRHLELIVKVRSGVAILMAIYLMKHANVTFLADFSDI
jgi:hypothetical protein